MSIALVERSPRARPDKPRWIVRDAMLELPRTHAICTWHVARHFVGLKGNGDDDARSNVGATPPLTAAPEFDTDSIFAMSHKARFRYWLTT